MRNRLLLGPRRRRSVRGTVTGRFSGRSGFDFPSRWDRFMVEKTRYLTWAHVDARPVYFSSVCGKPCGRSEDFITVVVCTGFIGCGKNREKINDLNCRTVVQRLYNRDIK